MNIYGWLLIGTGFLFGVLEAMKIVALLHNKHAEAQREEVQVELEEIEKQVCKQGRTAMYHEGQIAAYAYRNGQLLSMRDVRKHARGEAESYCNDFPCACEGYYTLLVDAWCEGFAEVQATIQDEQRTTQRNTTAQQFVERQARVARENTPRRTDDLNEPTQQTRSMHHVG